MHCKKYVIGSYWIYSSRVLCEIFMLERIEPEWKLNTSYLNNFSLTRKQAT